MKRCLVALLALGVAFTVSAQSGGEELFLPKKTKIVQGPIQLSRNVTGVLTAKVMLNGKPVKLMVDTGATHTTLDKNYLQKHFPNLRILPMTFSGETNIQAALSCAKVASLKAGKSEFNAFYAIVIPMEHFVDSLEGEAAVGILGMNALAH